MRGIFKKIAIFVGHPNVYILKYFKNAIINKNIKQGNKAFMQ